jgi:hypothetical protein
LAVHWSAFVSPVWLRLNLAVAGVRSLAVHWSAFKVLFESLDQFAPHLIESAWPMIDKLHRPSDGDPSSSGAEPNTAVGSELVLTIERLHFTWAQVSVTS